MKSNLIKLVIFNLVAFFNLMWISDASAVSYFALPPSSFITNPATDCMMNGSDSVPNYRAGILYAPTSGTDCVAYAPIPLPQGTAVSKIEATVYDDDASCQVAAYFDEGTSTGGSGGRLSATSSDTAGTQTLTLKDSTGATTNYTLKSGGYAYYIRLIITPDASASRACGLGQVKITY